MSGRLDGKVAVITGGASGIGRATAHRMLSEGAAVVIGDYNAQNGQVVLEEARDAGFGERVRFSRIDVASEPDVQTLMASATDEFGRLDIAFNNAGVGGAFGPITDVDLGDWDYTVGIMLTGVFLGIKHAARIMKKQGTGGVIVNTASVAGVGGGCGPHAYSACKAGVINLTNTTAVELAEHRIRVTAICPGAINTPLINLGNPDGMGQVYDEVQPWYRCGTPEDVAALVTFLSTDDAEFITGTHIVIDGALVAQGPDLLGTMGGGMLGTVAGVAKSSTGEESELHPLVEG